MKYKRMSSPTEYKDITFRSKLEAKWAVFFDQMNIDWKYEPHKFYFNERLSYLPDFYLPNWNLFIEVKPKFPAEDFLYRQIEGTSPIGQVTPRFKIKPVIGSQMNKGHLLGSYLGCQNAKKIGDGKTNIAYSINYILLCGYPGYPRFKRKGPILDVSTGSMFVHFANLMIDEELNIEPDGIFTEIKVPALTNGGTRFDIWPMYIIDLIGNEKLLKGGRSFPLPEIEMITETDELFSSDICGCLMKKVYRGKGVVYRWDSLSDAYKQANNYNFDREN